VWNLILGISEVVWGWWNWLLESGIGWKLTSESLWALQHVTALQSCQFGEQYKEKDLITFIKRPNPSKISLTTMIIRTKSFDLEDGSMRTTRLLRSNLSGTFGKALTNPHDNV